MSSSDENNPLFDLQYPIAFDRIRAEHVRPGIGRLLAQARARLRELENDERPRTYDNTLAVLEEVTEPLSVAMNVVGHLEAVTSSAELRAAYNEMQPQVSEFLSNIPLSAPLWKALEAFSRTEEAARLEPTRLRFLTKTMDEFRREGAELDEQGKKELTAINVELSQLTTRFSQNVLDATNAFELIVEERERLEGLPERVLQAARASARARGQPGYRFTLQAPSFIPVMTHCADASIRRQLYLALQTRATDGDIDNRPVVAKILELRKRKAALLGYRDFADLVLSDRMAANGERAKAFVRDLRARTETQFQAENEQLAAFYRELEGADAPRLAMWDVPYYAERQRKARFDFDEEALRPYFPLQRVVAGMFELVHRLYGVKVEADPTLGAWHEDVRCYRVIDADGSVLGAFFADLFPRDNKRDGAWMNAFITGGRSAEGWSPHLGAICANVTPASEDGPALLSHREVETLFHEFGHLMHHMLTRVEVRSLAGTNVAWDFVELPSQIMENWCWEREALEFFARHHDSGESVPDELFEKMSRARTYRSANHMMRQLGFATVDLALHTEYQAERDGNVIEYARQVAQTFAPAELPPEYAMVASFNHLFGHPIGYAAGYYSYKWAEVLDADAFSRFRREGLFSREVGSQFREAILARGDSRDPMELFKAFMGREPGLDALLQRCGLLPEAAS